MLFEEGSLIGVHMCLEMQMFLDLFCVSFKKKKMIFLTAQ